MDGAATFAGIRGIGYRLRVPNERAQNACPPTADSITDPTNTPDAE